MTAKEWLETMKQAQDYNHAMTPLIVKYGEMLLEEQKVANKNFILSDVSRCNFFQSGRELWQEHHREESVRLQNLLIAKGFTSCSIGEAEGL
ncbi:MAG: hypothetical protein ACEQSL_11640, partial [Sediminibacterium sp.]